MDSLEIFRIEISFLLLLFRSWMTTVRVIHDSTSQKINTSIRFTDLKVGLIPPPGILFSSHY